MILNEQHEHWMRYKFSIFNIFQSFGVAFQDNTKMEEDKKALRSSLEDAENRCTKLELTKRALEGDIQRTKLVLTDKDTEIQV